MLAPSGYGAAGANDSSVARFSVAKISVSLNATTDEQRARLMPAVSRMASLDTLLFACRRYPLAPHRRLTFEYVLLAGVNDRKAEALRLVQLIRGISCKASSAAHPTRMCWRSNRSCARPVSTSSFERVGVAMCLARAGSSETFLHHTAVT